MKIIINGKEDSITPLDGKININELLAIKNVEMPDMVSVELNEVILNRADFVNTFINHGDRVEFLYFMGGGAA